jgi:predicted CXXCH cytochrome family protein
MKGKLRVLIAVAAAVLLIAALAPVALADNEPHDSTMLTEADSCAACHRAHTAQAAKLLKETATQDAFCFTCHDGSAAETNVVDGVLAGTSYGSNGGPLRGGGFTNALMDNDHDGSAVSAAVTSTHNASGTVAGTIWGSGPINAATDYGVSVDLACGDCHNPHGNGNYRILRGNPDGMENEGTAPAVDVTDEVTIVYEITYTANDYRDMSDYASGTPNDIGEWCSQCHTRYWAGANAGETDSGDAVFVYRHMTDGLTGSCLSCHVAHGTSATMGAYSNTVTYPDGTTQGGNESRLLTGDNRSVCTDPDSCHGDGGWGLTED